MLAAELRKAGHTVHALDLFFGRRFATLQEGLAYASEVGFEEIIARGERAASALLAYSCVPVRALPHRRETPHRRSLILQAWMWP